MKICFLGWGDHIHTRRWVSWFARRGHEVSLISQLPVRIDNVRVYTVDQARDLDAMIRNLQVIVDEVGPDIIHSHTARYPGYLSLFLGFHPLVFTFWDGDVIWSGLTKEVHKVLVRKILKRADLLTCNSHLMKDLCLLRGAHEERIAEIQWGVDLNMFNPSLDVSRLRKEFGLCGAKVVLSTRSLLSTYNIETIIQAIPLIIREVPNARFVFTWHLEDGGYRVRLESLIRSLGISKEVRWIGYREDHGDIAALCALSDVFVSISFEDSSPVSLLEAMASGASPIVGDLPGIREWVKDGVNGYIVNPCNHLEVSNKVVELLRNKKTRERFSRRNLYLVKERACHDKNMVKMEEIYYGLIEGGLQQGVSLESNNAFFNGLFSHLIGDKDKAKEMYKKDISEGPSEPDSFFLLGVIYGEEGRTAEAISLIEKGVDSNGFPPSEYFSHLGVLYERSRRRNASIRHFRRAIELDTGDVTASTWINTLRYLSLPRQDVSVKKCLTKDLVSLRDVYLPSCILFEKGFKEEAFELLKGVLVSSYDEDIYCGLGDYLLLKGRQTEAIECFRRAIEIDPGYLKPRYDLAVALEALGRLSEALEELDFVLQDGDLLNENLRYRSLYHRGVVMMGLGRLEEARQDLRMCLGVNPAHQEARSLLKRLARSMPQKVTSSL